MLVKIIVTQKELDDMKEKGISIKSDIIDALDENGYAEFIGYCTEVLVDEK